MSKPGEGAVVVDAVERLNLVLAELCELGVKVKLAPMYPDDRREVCVIVEGVRIEGKRLAVAPRLERGNGRH